MSINNSPTVLCLPRASSFSPRLRIVAWSDTASVRRKFMYGGSQTSLGQSTTPSLPVPHREHTHDILSTKSLRERPQTIPYRPKSGVLSSRPCSAPPPRRIMYKNKRGDVAMTSSPPGVPVSTLNLALPSEVQAAKPASVFQPRIPPKKQCAVWYSSGVEGVVQRAANSPGIMIPNPCSPGAHISTHAVDHELQRAFTETEVKKKYRRKRVLVDPKRDLHLSHKIAHLTQQIKDCKDSQGVASRATTIVIT